MNYLITGAGRGIGLELTLFALENGHSVITLVREPNNARSLAQAKKEYGDKLSVFKCDIADPESLAQAHSQAHELLGDFTLDVLINNAGVLLDDEERFDQLPLEKVINSLHVNAVGPVSVTQAFLPNLNKSASAKLVNITSQMGSIADNASGGYYGYRMSKAALNMFAKSFAVDHPKIITLLIHPGWVRTDMGGAQAPLLPRESARGVFKVISEATKNETGRFFDYKGKELPW